MSDLEARLQDVWKAHDEAQWQLFNNKLAGERQQDAAERAESDASHWQSFKEKLEEHRAQLQVKNSYEKKKEYKHYNCFFFFY